MSQIPLARPSFVRPGFVRLTGPANVVECQPVEVAVADKPFTGDILDPLCKSYHIKSRLCSTTRRALHGCHKRDGLEHYAKELTQRTALSSIFHKCIKHYNHATPERLIGVYVYSYWFALACLLDMFWCLSLLARLACCNGLLGFHI